MSDIKRRVKTGCLSCRQRRVKCDEKKPVCQRCEAANIACNGYTSPRKLNPSRLPRGPIVGLQKETQTPSAPALASHQVASPLFAYPGNPDASQRPHQRAREILGHQQYSSRTAQLLFRDSHLYFWRDYLLNLAWDTEYVFDAVIALGIMHRAVIMLSDPSDKWRGLDNKVVAFQIYAGVLKNVSEKCGEAPGRQSETLVAVLLLLTYFEVR
jgi:hypothetical protein